MECKEEPNKLATSIFAHQYTPVGARENEQHSAQPWNACRTLFTNIVSLWRVREQSRVFSRGQESREDECSKSLVEGDFIWYESPYEILCEINDDDCVVYNQWEDEEERLSHAQVWEGWYSLKIKEEQNLKDVQTKLGAWAFHEEAARTSSVLSAGVGPVIPWLRASAAASICLQVLLFCYLRAASSCTEAPVAWSAQLTVVLVAVLVARIFLEWQALRHVLPAFVRYCDFTLLGFPISFRVWLAICFTLSQLSFIDIGTDTLFAASAMQVLECQEVAIDIWQEVWQQSLPHKLGVSIPSLWWVVATWWVASLLQMVVPVLRTIRRTDLTCQTLHKFRQMGQSRLLCGSDKKRVSLLHGNIVWRLADANGMATLQALAIPFYTQIFSSEGTVLSSTLNQIRAANHITDQVFDRVFLSYFLESTLQLNIQSTLYVIGIAIHTLRKVNTQVETVGLLSMVATLLTTVVRLSEPKDILKVQPAKMTGLNGEDAQFLSNAMQMNKVRIWLVVLLLVLSLIYAVAKLVMANVCEDAVWNVTGCVSLQMLQSAK